MKKVFSIVFASIVLLSGMHLSIATHYCGGELAQVKVSFTHENASCGMCEEETDYSAQTLSNESCCRNELAYFVVDTNFNASTFQISKPAHSLLQVFDIPKTIGILSSHTNSTLNINVQPPGAFIACAVSLPDICVFRI